MTLSEPANPGESKVSPSPVRHLVGIATRGRPAILCETLQDLEKQVRRPDRVLVAYTEPSDVADAPQRFPTVEFILSEVGLTRQRNAILDALEGEDLVTFIDDDFFLHPDYLSAVEGVFNSQPRVILTTGNVLADGINGPGLSVSEAREVLARQYTLGQPAGLKRAFNAYGCNMSMRTLPVRTHKLRFDENLPLYGWYEDVEFSRQIANYGEIALVTNACGVHLGAKSGRQSGFRLGYSQVANPVYLARKRSVPWSYAIASMTSRSMKNLVRSISPESFVDRRGRLRGNLRAWRELITGEIFPTRILHF